MAAQFLFFFALLALSLQISLQKSTPTDATYDAAVVEFKPSSVDAAIKRTTDNLSGFLKVIESEDTRDLDILVFPEYVLNNMEHKTFVPDPSEHIAPCDVPNTDWFLTELSCAARSRDLYLVVNLLEKAECKDKRNCDEHGLNTYNTNVVFDRKGRVISRYRKTHLYKYEWYSTNVLDKPQTAIFDTDFGVKFGHFICFDMLFYEPAMTLVRDMNISDIIYPTFWFSELPFLAANQLQQGWAYANDVNLLAANSGNPSGRNSGSGIYAGKLGTLAATVNEEPTTKLLRVKVPKRNRRAEYVFEELVPVFTPNIESPRLTKLKLSRDYNVDIFTTKLLAANFLTIGETLCHQSFCCHFSGKRTLISESAFYSAYRYRLAAYKGDQTTHQRIDPSEQAICSIIACTNEDLYSCGVIFPESVRVGNKYYFESLHVNASFPHAARRAILPNTLDGQIMPLPLSMLKIQEVSSAQSTEYSIALTSNKLDILTFGIWANYYTTRESTHNLNPQRAAPRSNGAENLATGHVLVITLISLLTFNLV